MMKLLWSHRENLRYSSHVNALSAAGVNTAAGYTEAQARGPAEALGIALQLTNILRDVGTAYDMRYMVYGIRRVSVTGVAVTIVSARSSCSWQ